MIHSVLPAPAPAADVDVRSARHPDEPNSDRPFAPLLADARQALDVPRGPGRPEDRDPSDAPTAEDEDVEPQAGGVGSDDVDASALQTRVTNAFPAAAPTAGTPEVRLDATAGGLQTSAPMSSSTETGGPGTAGTDAPFPTTTPTTTTPTTTTPTTTTPTTTTPTTTTPTIADDHIPPTRSAGSADPASTNAPPTAPAATTRSIEAPVPTPTGPELTATVAGDPPETAPPVVPETPVDRTTPAGSHNPVGTVSPVGDHSPVGTVPVGDLSPVGDVRPGADEAVAVRPGPAIGGPTASTSMAGEPSSRTIVTTEGTEAGPSDAVAVMPIQTSQPTVANESTQTGGPTEAGGSTRTQPVTEATAEPGGRATDAPVQPPQPSVTSSGPSDVDSVQGTSTAARALPDEMLEQMWGQVERALHRVRATPEGHDLRLRLRPAELGELMIRVQTDENGITVRLVASSPGAQQVLENDSARLRAELARAGFDQAFVTVGTEDDRRNGASNQRGGARDGTEHRDTGRLGIGPAGPTGRDSLYAPALLAPNRARSGSSINLAL